jgi:hypothetical protein
MFVQFLSYQKTCFILTTRVANALFCLFPVSRYSTQSSTRDECNSALSVTLTYHGRSRYLQREWTLTEVSNFMDKVDELIDLLTKENLTFKPTDYKNTFQVPVVKQINLYYRIENNNIELMRFWNNYQDLGKFHL